jgi:low affinity Fe/Cu permease
MASLTKDDIWKMIQIMMSVTILPLAGWVWNTNVKVAELQNDLGDAEEVIAVLEKKIESSDDNARNIIGIEKDIEYMKGSLGRIEQMVTRKAKNK